MDDGWFRMSVSHRYLVVEPFLLIGEDLAHAISEFDPDAEVLVAMDEDEALRWIVHGTVIDRAFLHSDPAKIGATALGRALTEAKATMIFIGDKAERSAAGPRVLHRPFDGKAVATMLAALVETEA